jgi:hypothetical protein
MGLEVGNVDEVELSIDVAAQEALRIVAVHFSAPA